MFYWVQFPIFLFTDLICKQHIENRIKIFDRNDKTVPLIKK